MSEILIFLANVILIAVLIVSPAALLLNVIGQ